MGLENDRNQRSASLPWLVFVIACAAVGAALYKANEARASESPAAVAEQARMANLSARYHFKVEQIQRLKVRIHTEDHPIERKRIAIELMDARDDCRKVAAQLPAVFDSSACDA